MKYMINSAVCILLLLHQLEAQVSLHLLLNSSDTDTITPGDPILLELQLYHAEAEYSRVHNDVVRENLVILEEEYTKGEWTEEEYRSEKEILENSIKRTEPIVVPGKSLLTGLQILYDDTRLSYSDYTRCGGYPEEEEYSLDGEGRLYLLFGIPPALTAGWAAGSHTFRIIVDSLSTNSTTLRIVSSEGEKDPLLAKQIRLAYFHLDCGNPEQALVIANQILVSSPDHLEALTLKADAFLAAEDFTQALEWYQKALAQFQLQRPDMYELPEYLLSQIASLQDQR